MNDNKKIKPAKMITTVRFDDLFDKNARFCPDMLATIYEVLLDDHNAILRLVIKRGCTKKVEAILRRFRMSELFNVLLEE